MYMKNMYMKNKNKNNKQYRIYTHILDNKKATPKYYLIKNDIDNLNVRKGPSIKNEKWPGYLTKGVHKVYEEVNGFGRIDDTNKDKWIDLKYVSKYE